MAHREIKSSKVKLAWYETNKPSKIAYNDDLYNSDKLTLWASRALDVLPEETEVLVSSGSSGCSLAAAMLVLSTRLLEHYHVKAHPNNHGNGIYTTGKNAVIIDDFISSGATMRRILEAARTRFNILAIVVSHNNNNHVEFLPDVPIICLEVK